MPNPIDHAELYNRIELAGVRSPGQVTLSGHARVEGWDVKQASGSGGASTTRKGEEVAQFTASFFLVRATEDGSNEYEEWDAFLPLLRSSTAGKTPVALTIYHPDLAELDIKSVVVKSIGGKVYDGKGGATVQVQFLEYRPPKPKKGSPSGSKEKYKGYAEYEGKIDSNADRKAQVAALTEEAQKP